MDTWHFKARHTTPEYTNNYRAIANTRHVITRYTNTWCMNNWHIHSRYTTPNAQYTNYQNIDNSCINS